LNFGPHTFLRRINFRIIILTMTVLSMANVTAGVFFGRFFPVGYFSDKSISRIASDLAFVEGAVIFFAGAVLTFFRSNISPRVIALMIIGAAMVGLSVLLGVFS
jgi:hypothetical protein